jgi:hypothetical protein
MIANYISLATGHLEEQVGRAEEVEEDLEEEVFYLPNGNFCWCLQTSTMSFRSALTRQH